MIRDVRCDLFGVPSSLDRVKIVIVNVEHEVGRIFGEVITV